jgi:four helix bundle protein
MQDRKNDLRDRTKQFALKIIRLYSSLPKNKPAQIIGGQLLRSGTSVGANYREACRARSNSEFISETGIVIQELDETTYWLELLFDAKIDSTMNLTSLMTETNELIAIFTSIMKKVRNG